MKIVIHGVFRGKTKKLPSFTNSQISQYTEIIMKQIFWMKYLSAVLVFTSLMPVSSIKVAAVPIYLAQANAYNQYMQLGYDATRQRDYPVALNYFKQARQQRPGDRYATAAVRNIEGYITRDRQAARQGRSRLAFTTPIGTPSRRVPGASRGGCKQGKEPLTALIPEIDPQLTTAGYPVFFFFIPQTPAQTLEFALTDENDEPLYNKTFKTTGEPGIVSLRLPANLTVPPLKIGKTYRWSFSIICDRQDRSGDLVVEGSIQRIEPDPNLVSELKKAKPQERAALYATAGFWQDTLATLAKLRRSRPTDSGVRTDWEELLKSVGLERIAQEPLLQCCEVQK
jgi:hypothetical protein